MAAVMGLDSSPFRHVPMEVLLNITSDLTTPDLCSFRITCHAIADLLDESFVKEFFSRKQFMFSEFSLSALIDISKSRLGRHLTRLQFGTNTLPKIPTTAPDHFMGSIFDGDGLDCFKAAAADEFWFLATGLVTEYLAEALSRLPNLEEIVIREFDSPKRYRDGPIAPWSSYGARTIAEHSPGLAHMDRHGSLDRMFATTLSALGKTWPAVSPRFRGVEVLSYGNHICLTEKAFYIPKYLESSLDPVIARLEKLHLAINGRHATEIIHTPNGNVSQLVLFLRQAKSLRDLRINAYRASSRSPPSTRGRMLTADSRLLELITDDDQLKLPMLETLSLGFFVVFGDPLLAMLRKFGGTLRSLSLWKVRLCCPLPEPDEVQASDFEPRQKFWTSFLSALREIDFDKLYHVQIGHMQQRWLWDDSTLRNYTISNRAEGLTRVHPMLEYRGIDWKHYILDNIDSLKYEWPWSYEHAVAQSGGSEEDDLSMSDDDNEDDDHDEEEEDNDEDGDNHGTLM